MGKDYAYSKAVERTFTLADFERGKHSPNHSLFHLERMRLLCEDLGNPQSSLPSVHVAGTKGKGTTSAMIASMLGYSGLKVGLITSPHLHSLTERIQVGGDPISKDDFVDLVEEIWPAVLRVDKNGSFGAVTWFEFMVAAAFFFFQKSSVDFQVVETGLGGRLDATNVLTPAVSVITSISLDHTNILGDTIAKIAAEKAGIIKDEVPVVISPQTEEALKVIKTIAHERNTSVKKATREFDVVVKKHDLSGQLLNIETPRRRYEFKLPLIGKHQMENALTAICTVETLEELGHQIDKDCVESGMANLSWPGRFEVLKSSDPIVIVDGAHNPDSMDKLVNTVKDSVNSSRIIVVFGSIGGHDITEMLESLKSLNPILIPVSSRHPKSVSCEVVKETSLGCGIDTIGRYDTVSQGLDYALSIASEKDLVLATGSLSVVAEVSEAINQISPEFYYNLP